MILRIDRSGEGSEELLQRYFDQGDFVVHFLLRRFDFQSTERSERKGA